MSEFKTLVPPSESLSKNESSKWRRRAKNFIARTALVAAGGSALLGAAYGAMDSQSGQYRYYPAAEGEEWLAAGEGLQSEEGSVDDNELRTATYNVQNKLLITEVEELIEEYQLDTIKLQEVNKNHADKYAEYFTERGLHVIFSPGTFVPVPNNNKFNGFGNMTILRYEPEDIKAVSLSGTPLLERWKIITGDHKYNQEKRAVIIASFTKGDEEYVDINSHISHITDGKIHNEQLEKLAGLIREHTEEGRFTSACADYNNNRERILEVVNDGEDIFDAPETGRTSVTHDKVIDHCVFNRGVLQVIKAEALTESKSDHYPVIVIFGEFETDKPAAKLYSDLPY